MILRVCIVALSLSILSLFLFSFTITTKIANDVWSDLGITQQSGTEKIRNSFLNNYFDCYGVRNAKNIAAGNRVAVAKDLLTYAKQYINSAAFKTAYEETRNQSKPVKPEIKSLSKEEIRKNMIDEMEKSLREAEANMKKLSPEIQKSVQPVLDMQKKTIEEYKNPDNEVIDMMYQQQAYQQKGNEEQYEEDLKKWQENFPEDYKQLIKMRLQKYLDIATTVDFNATLIEKYGKNRFTNPLYEGKNKDWKMIYRAGKEVYNAARPFAEQWIGEL